MFPLTESETSVNQVSMSEKRLTMCRGKCAFEVKESFQWIF